MTNMPETSLQEYRTYVTVPDGLGLHARPAARLATLAQQFLSDIWLSLASNSSGVATSKEISVGSVVHGPTSGASIRGTMADGKSIVDLLALAAPAGTVLFFYCKGVDAAEAQEAIVSFFTEKGWQGG